MDTDDGGARLVGFLLDDLGPALQWYREEVGRLLGLAPAELVCLDLARRLGSAWSSQVAERTGLTRSAVAKMLRRLESAGHLERSVGPERGAEVEIALRPHAERDAVLAGMRRELARALAPIAWADEAAIVPYALGRAAHELQIRARALGDDAAERRRLDARRRAREADPIRPWWEPRPRADRPR